MTETSRRLIYDLDLHELEQIFKNAGQLAYRAKQVWQGLYCQLWDSPEQFTSLPKSLRAWLDETFAFKNLAPDQVLLSTDGDTRKTLFQLPDGKAVEAVLMHYDVRKTLCNLTPSRLRHGLRFLCTGQMGFKRHLTMCEIRRTGL